MHYVYLLENGSPEPQRYIGVTTDLKRRFAEHSAGKARHTSKYKPWRLVTYVAFSDELKAASFERYLKSGSGHAFAKRHLWSLLRRNAALHVDRQHNSNPLVGSQSLHDLQATEVCRPLNRIRCSACAIRWV